ncbi:MAG: hypothetical protein DI609_10410 [Corynebacterium urealyticum]|uniref:Chitin-binding type-3 domain-containing protein n=1 Tax=Corynebacterium urealyticum TaxID=43771 RepID=A0A2W5B1L4_9CORY|nr:MAG: hypothetical protein DI609_10410 [Corynebacterium urealyticum]
MPVHFGNRKIKELYLGGRKIKEAWYGGKKVYSLAPPVKPGVYPWHDEQDYHRGDLVHLQGIVYKCIQDHQADRGKSKPGEGWDQYSYWTQVGYAAERDDIRYDPWKNSKYYYSGDIVTVTFNGEERDFKCTQRHSASVSTKPGSSGGYQYWELIPKSGDTGGSTPTQPANPPSTPTNPPTSSVSAWRTGVNYKKGDLATIDVYGDVYRYTALVDHYSSADSKPFYGPVENIYWGNPAKVN